MLRFALVAVVIAVAAFLMGDLAAARSARSGSTQANALSIASSTPTSTTEPPAPVPSTSEETTPAAPTTTVPPTTSTTAAPQKTVVVFGDSVPAGTACNCGGFGADVASAMSAKLINFSVPGLTTDGLVAQLASSNARAALRTASVVLVTIGANDFNEADAYAQDCSDLSCYADTLPSVTANLTSILNSIKSQTPTGARVIATGYWNVFLDGQVGAANGPTYVSISDGLTRTLNDAIARLTAAAGVQYTDVYAPFKGTGNLDDTALLAPDGDHPDAAGHNVIANAILTTLRASGG
jgi:lysophospholipase L1-like esterase